MHLQSLPPWHNPPLYPQCLPRRTTPCYTLVAAPVELPPRATPTLPPVAPNTPYHTVIPPLPSPIPIPSQAIIPPPPSITIPNPSVIDDATHDFGFEPNQAAFYTPPPTNVFYPGCVYADFSDSAPSSLRAQIALIHTDHCESSNPIAVTFSAV
ncbi:hypothetical protein SARC_08773 [Sphaeroforma arctica JP610]|uniref:Uncharacterized protein n=1 Tax=Sphaeroforma arctica JP610 TaxID=667725 RepID=A0A0L0FQ09_9EUKA|nr:hypothetical protein SARC_08773 [Sphaeroforma arctica JP610]KNC78804.1 hypothetical protein SARC_08773 [Sphaeroforma arctica JP610]|eukprot:XP_014152706.1 hypothetical protein SARC_08773 [Sphaeroforma arctica JP610]